MVAASVGVALVAARLDGGQSRRRGIGVIVIDVNHVSAGTCQQAGADAGPESGSAVHPQPTLGEVSETGEQVTEGHVGGMLDVPLGSFVVAAHIQDHVVAAGLVGDLGKIDPGVTGTGGGVLRDLLQAATARPRELVNTDPDELPLCIGDLLGGVCDYRQRRTPGCQPSHVRGELGTQRNADRALDVVSGISGAIA